MVHKFYYTVPSSPPHLIKAQKQLQNKTYATIEQLYFFISFSSAQPEAGVIHPKGKKREQNNYWITEIVKKS